MELEYKNGVISRIIAPEYEANKIINDLEMDEIKVIDTPEAIKKGGFKTKRNIKNKLAKKARKANR